MLRGLQWTTVIERTFAAETEAERNAWCQAIEHVAGMLQVRKTHTPSPPSSSPSNLYAYEFDFVEEINRIA